MNIDLRILIFIVRGICGNSKNIACWSCVDSNIWRIFESTQR